MGDGRTGDAGFQSVSRTGSSSVSERLAKGIRSTLEKKHARRDVTSPRLRRGRARRRRSSRPRELPGGRRSRNRHESGAQRGAREIGDAPRTRRRRTRSLRHLGPSSRVRLTRDSVSQRPGGRCDSLERRPARRGAGLDARRYEARALVFRCGGRKRSGFTRLWQRRARDEWRGEQRFKEGQVLCGVRFWIALGSWVLKS